MELTQRLEFTQELYSDNCGKPCPEQIGFLGICGTKYPLKKGPNKIGRDPQTCNIVLNLNSISRQHAVINILNNQNFMLMDLDSANKTKLADKKLEPYIPHPLKNGDMVQFGEVFGVFRLLEEENDLPMTQAMDIPDTPVHHRHISKVNIHATTIPESPEVSDKEDSFVTASQQQQKPKNVFKSPNNNFIKSTGKAIASKPVGTNKVDNVCWISSKKTDSFSSKANISYDLDDSVVLSKSSDTNSIVRGQSIHEMDTQIPNENVTKEIHELDTQIPNENVTKEIHELDTQIPNKEIHELNTQISDENKIKDIHELDTQIPNENVTKEIHELDTQVPNVDPNDCVDSIYNATTQIMEHSPDIYELKTQLPTTEKLPEVYKIHDQENLRIDISTDNKENDIYNSETQVPFNEKLILQKENIFNSGTQVKDNAKVMSPNSNENVTKPKSASTSNVSDDIILFDEIEIEPIDDNFESQQLLSPKLNVDKQVDDKDKDIPDSQVINFFPHKRTNRIESDSSTDCEDINIAATQILPQINKKDEELIDCEDEANATLKTNKNGTNSHNIDEDLTDCEELDDNDVIKPNTVIEKDTYEDLLTQVLDDTSNQNKPALNNGVEDLPTQRIIIEENKIDENNQNISDLPTQVLDPEPQKETCFEEALTQKLYSEELVQFKVPLQSSVKKKKKNDCNVSKISDTTVTKSSDVIEVLDDDDEKYYAATQELFDDLCSQRPLSPIIKGGSSEPFQSPSTASSDIDIKEKVSDSVPNLTCSQIQDIVGVQKQVTVLKKVHSDGSDVAVTPKKIDSFAVLETDLPNTQEIKTGISLIPNSDTESLPDDLTESEIDSLSEKSTPIKVKKHKAKMTQKIRINLSDKFDPETIPVRSSSRVRKPTTRIQNCDETFKDMAEKILKPVLIKEERFKQSSKVEHVIEKSHKSSTKDNTTTSTGEKGRRNTKINSSGKLDPDIYEHNKSKRGRPAKQKSDKNDQKQKPKTNVVVTDKFNEDTNSNSAGRNTRSKQKEAKIKDASKSSKTITPDKSKSDDTSKSSREPSRERSKSPEITKKSKPSRERSKSPEIIKKSKPSRQRSKSPEIIKKTKPSRERSKSPEIIKKSKPSRQRSKSPEIIKKSKPSRERSKPPEIIKSSKPTRERSKSPEMVNKRKHAKERSKSPEMKFNRKPKERPKSSEKTVTRKTNKDFEESVVPTESEIRRSKRNRNKKSEEPINNSKTQSPIREISAVYSTINVSPDTTSESPNRKRAAPSEIEKPTAKKLKSILRATPARKCKTQYVLFTAFACEEVKDKLEKLGAVVVSDVMACTVVLTVQIKRTFKLLCAVGLGKPIVGPNWVQACADTNMIVDPWLYLLQDEATEKRFKFNLQRTLAGKREFLKGYNVSSTPNVMPNQPEMKLIVECSGGKWQEGGAKWVCVSTPADRALWTPLRQRGAVVVSTEFILGGVLTQKLDIERNLL